jgi:hypothetical protein
MKSKLTFIFVLVMFISCDSLRIEKRKYMKGFYVGHSKIKHNDLSKKEEFENPGSGNPESDPSYDGVSAGISSEPVKIKTTSIFSTEKNSVIPENKIFPTQTRSGIKKKKVTIESSKTNFEVRKKIWNEINWKWLALMCGITGLTFGYAFKYHKSSLMSLQAWSYKNKFKARALMFVAKTSFIIGGFWFGVKLSEHHYLFPSYGISLLTAGYVLSILIYPFRKSSIESAFSFLRKKFSGLVMSLCGLLLCMNLGNRVATENANGINTDKHINKRSADYFESKKSVPDHSTSLNTGQILSGIFVNDTDDTGTYALKLTLSVLAIISIVILEIFVLVFGCMLACDGSEGAAFALIFFGTVFLAALSIATLYWISRIKLNSSSATRKE